MTTDASHLRHVYGVDADVVDVDLSDRLIEHDLSLDVSRRDRDL